MASKDDQIVALPLEIRNHLSGLEAWVKRVEDEVQRTHSDVVTAGQWTGVPSDA
jgi:hypothetical protein